LIDNNQLKSIIKLIERLIEDGLPQRAFNIVPAENRNETFIEITSKQAIALSKFK